MPWYYNGISDSDDDDDGMDDVAFGTFRGDIVGIRYYRGTVNNREMVSLNREPNNPYDRNAIRVDNVFRVQVGHIKRQQAAVLARLIDSKRARVDGVVPFGVNNKFSMPCDITLWGDEENREAVCNEMRRAGYPLGARPVSKSSGFSEGSANSSFSGRNPVSSSVRVAAQTMKKELDQLFDKIAEDTTKASAQEPADAIKTSLFPHQKQALSWMIACENSDALPPFWKERGPKDFFNSATNFSATKRPVSVKGGILADDMGLGKTLEIISLILTNFKNGKSLVTIDKSKPVMLSAEDGAIVKQKKPRKKAKAKAKLERCIEILDDEEDEKMQEALPDLPSFTAKDDPEFTIPVADVPVVPARTSSRPQRTQKRPARYTFDDDDCDIIEEEIVAVEEPKKKGKRKKKADKKAEVPEPVVQFTVPEATISTEGPATEIKPLAEVKPLSELKPVAEEQLPVVESVVEVEADVNMNITVPTSEKPAIIVPSDENAAPIQTYKGKKTKAGGSRATLVICPLSVLSNWQDEIDRHVWPGLVDVYTYYGSDRIRDSDVLAQKDIVLTTYQTLTADASKANSPLKTTKWLRVVLDEGHCIRNPNTHQTKAVNALEADRRWVVTGTPIQNSMKDLWSIVCFLRLDPFKERQWWTRVMERPIKDGERDALGRLQQLMKVIALRRTKNTKLNGKPIVQIPEKSVFLNYVELSPEERDIYKAVAEKGKVTIGKYMKAGTLLKNYTEVLVILTRLRQLCCHPKLCTAALEAAAKEAVENSTPEELRKRLTAILAMLISSGADEECPICLDSLNTPVITHCAHIYCKNCIENVIKKTGSVCPLCRGIIALNKLVEAPADQLDETLESNDWTSSAKVDALLNALEKQRRTDPTIKCLVVSQFTSYLKLLKQPLEGRGFNYVSLDGSLSQDKRAQAIREFSDPKPGSPTIFLLSLRAGGVGLNLTAASRVYLMDPAWNPAAEDQCFDRCHRLGQTKTVEIHKFIVKDSIEERMLELQEKKRKLMTGAFEKQKADEMRQQRIKDVTNLMNLNA